MKLKYLPDERVIIQDDPDRPIIASLTMASLEGITVLVLAKAMAEAPALVCLLDYIMDIEPDDYGDRTLSTEGMQPIREALSAFTLSDLVALTHFTHIMK